MTGLQKPVGVNELCSMHFPLPQLVFTDQFSKQIYIHIFLEFRGGEIAGKTDFIFENNFFIYLSFITMLRLIYS